MIKINSKLAGGSSLGGTNHRISVLGDPVSSSTYDHHPIRLWLDGNPRTLVHSDIWTLGHLYTRALGYTDTGYAGLENGSSAGALKAINDKKYRKWINNCHCNYKCIFISTTNVLNSILNKWNRCNVYVVKTIGHLFLQKSLIYLSHFLASLNNYSYWDFINIVHLAY